MIVGGTDGVYPRAEGQHRRADLAVEVSKRAILNSALFRDNVAYITHGEENIDTTEMGMVAAVDATGSGDARRPTRSSGARAGSCRRSRRR